MTSYPDPVFREGLEHYRKPAPASAWERIESGLDKKKHRSPWLKIAAGLFLLIATSVLIWKHTQTDTAVASVSKESTPIASNTGTNPSVETEELKDPIRESSDVSREIEVAGSSQAAQSSSIVERTSAERSRSSRNEPMKGRRQSAISRESSVVSREELNSTHESELISLTDTNKAIPAPPSVNQTPNTFEASAYEMSSDSRGTTISYSADMVNERFTKKECVAEATPEKKNASGLQKVIEKALDLKNEESLLGDLRDKKNDLLTINYSAKKRETNK